MREFTVVDANRNQIGPIPESEVRSLLGRGVIRLDSLAWCPGMAQWEPLRSFSEFIDVADLPPATLTSQSNPYAPPATRDLYPPAGPDGIDLNLPSSVRAQALCDEVLRRDYHLDVFNCIGRAWNLIFSGHFLNIVGVSTLAGIIVILSSACYASIVTTGPLMGGMDLYYLKKIRNREESDLNTAFSGFSIAFSQLFLTYLITALLGGVGFLFCVIPGIYLTVAWCFARVLVIDKKLDFWDAMECSRKVVTRHWFAVFALILVAALLMMSGFFALIIGLLITAPIRHAAMMYAYEDIFNPRRDPVQP